MKMRNPKTSTPKHRNLVALHARNLKGGQHRDRRARRSGNQDWLGQWLDEEADGTHSGNRNNERED